MAQLVSIPLAVMFLLEFYKWDSIKNLNIVTHNNSSVNTHLDLGKRIVTALPT